ncbi:glutathione-dependent formaldehyde dehydrogenase [Sphingopyxis bauzanensis]|uniref:Glutathione-dependent formaldehyde dehydrogenase n=1 Tax=Sphingopyxis bauzanensis TaxID=651663 RepID=A0A246JVA0_9SPHN|nr:zinc-dependent alcohol dehydrogenase [Sphingopyxis bauzanensis]OWQ96968.1 glutathione-dependent formaldehyde dehydrogenase [Sphingopyxis bauzanensis]GGJ42425.1 glutathione-dependent formaldehyde dehydrogenase [Sphingopyxis bauzanensis]
MRAVTWQGRHKISVETVPDPEIVNPRDAILRVTSTAICGSDLHLYDGYIPGMRAGDIVGHEFMGEVVDVGSGSSLKKGQRVVIPFTISCGQCFFCEKQQFSACDNANPAETRDASELLMGHAMGSAFGYAHLTGGYAGGQAEYVRVPYSDIGPVIIPDDLADEDVLFLSDILPTGWQAAINADIEPGDTVAIWGCGPVGLFTIQSARLLGADRVIAIDHFPARLALAKSLGAEILDYRQVNVREALDEMTGGIGPDACIDCVGMESHGFTLDNILDQVKAQFYSVTDRPHALRQAILACRKGGRVSIPGVYGGFADKFPLGQLMEKGLTVKSGQTHVQRYTGELLDMIRDGKFDMTSLVSHHAPLEDAAAMYRHWHDDQDDYTKIILKPGLEKTIVQNAHAMADA